MAINMLAIADPMKSDPYDRERKPVEEKKQVEEEQVKEKPLRKIDDELYERLRRKTPSSSIRKAVNKGVVLPMNDFALSGLKITTDKISRMEGFDKLSFKDQLEILNYRDNFIGLSESANKSKGSKSYKDWQYYKKDTSEEIEVCPEFREKMIDRENQLTKDLQNLINIKQKGVNNI